MMTHTFETPRLLLISTSEEDAAFIFELFNSPKWIKYIGDQNIKSVEDAKMFIREKILTHYEQKGFGTFTIIQKSNGNKMGTCGLYTREGIEGVDLGFAFLPQYEKNGYAFEASSPVIDIAKNKYNLQSLQAFTTEENIASQKSLEKLGFALQGTTQLTTGGEEMLAFKNAIWTPPS